MTSTLDIIEPENETEKNTFFAAYLSSLEQSTAFLTLFALFEEEFFLFLTIFSGENLDVPDLDRLKELQKRANVFYDLQDSSVSEIAEKYDMSERDVNFIKAKVSDQLFQYDVREVDSPTDRYEEAFEQFAELKS